MEREEVQRMLRELEKHCAQRGISLDGGGLAFGGSIGYGLDTPTSDVDLRGFGLPPACDILLLHDFETFQITDNADIAIHSLMKICSLFLACNPNAIELLGMSEEHVIIDSPAYRTLREHPEWFVSRRCAGTFGGYATQQLRRIENSMNREDKQAVSRNAARSIESALETLPERYPSLAQSSFEIVENGKEVVLSGELRNAGFSDLKAFADSCNEIAKNASSLAARNRKRESAKLSKHASHLIRLLHMGSEMLETGAINTWRGEDHDLLMEIKQGKWLVESADGSRSFEEEFWDLLNEEEARFERAKRETSLPAKPDEESVRDFIRDVHAQVIGSSAAAQRWPAQ